MALNRVRDEENTLAANTAESSAQAVVRLLWEPELAARIWQPGGRGPADDGAALDWRTVYQGG